MKVQLISKTSGKALQYVDGVLNGLGAEGPEGDIKASKCDLPKLYLHLNIRKE